MKDERVFLYVAAILLVVAIFPLPYFFYQFLRLFISLVAGYFAYDFYKSKQQNYALLLGFVALIFNPIAPLYLSKELWVVIDLATAGLFVYVKKKAEIKLK